MKIYLSERTNRYYPLLKYIQRNFNKNVTLTFVKNICNSKEDALITTSHIATHKHVVELYEMGYKIRISEN